MGQNTVLHNNKISKGQENITIINVLGNISKIANSIKLTYYLYSNL